MHSFVCSLLSAVLILACWPTLEAYAQAEASAVVLFQNARVFDGKSATLTAPMSVLIEGTKIARIGSAITAPAGATLIDAGGRTLMPGLIDAHTHMAMSVVPQLTLLTADPNYVQIVQAKAAGEMLLRGFTSARDAGGPTFGIKRAIDEGQIQGPRIWPAGAMVSQTSGHGDYRNHFDLPRKDGTPAHFSERLGYAVIADSPDEVRRGVREQLLRGASHIKLTPVVNSGRHE